MHNLNDLREQRAAVLDRMNAAVDDGEAFTAAQKEMRAMDEKIRRIETLEEAERNAPGKPINGDQKLDSEIRSRFSINRAIAAQCGVNVDAGFEMEIQPELAKRAGRKAEGIFVPSELFEKRIMTTSGNSAILPVDNRPDQFISALTANTIVRSLGATVLNGLTGNVSIPRETDSPAIGWVADNAALTSDDAAFDSLTLSPKHCGALSQWSRNMMMQTSPDVEQLLRNMLSRNIGMAIDSAAIRGGGANEPVGILATSGIQTVAHTGDNFLVTAADMIAALATANVSTDRPFLTTPGAYGKALKAPVSPEMTLPSFLEWQFHNHEVRHSGLMPTNLGTGTNEHGLIFADWSQLLIGVWSEIDILVNPYEATAYSKGNVMIRAMATADVGLRHKAAFVKATGVTL